MVTGSTPAVANACSRASGRQPCRAATSEVVTSRAAAPSEICEELPAVTTPSSAEDRAEPGQRLDRGPTADPLVGRNGADRRQLAASKAPESAAAAALACERTAISSSSVRDSFHRCAMISALSPCGTSPPTPAYRAIMRGPNGRPGPWVTVQSIGTRLIDSTPPATAMSYCPEITPAAAKCTACCDEPHCRSRVTPDHVLRPAGSQRGVAPDVDRLLAGLRHAAPDHVLDQRRVQPGPGDEGVQDVGRQVDRVLAGQAAAPPADRRPHGVDDHGVAAGHGCRSIVRHTITASTSTTTTAMPPIWTANRREGGA